MTGGTRDPWAWGGDPWESDHAEAINRAYADPTDGRFSVMDGIDELRASIKQTQEAWYDERAMSKPVRPEGDCGASGED